MKFTSARKGSLAVTLGGVLLICSYAPDAICMDDSTTSLDNLLQRWETRDGSASIEVGHELSEYFVDNPRSFLERMPQSSESWYTWLECLPVHTLTVFREGALPEYEEFRGRMIEASESLITDPNLGIVAEELLTVLKNTPIREID